MVWYKEWEGWDYRRIIFRFGYCLRSVENIFLVFVNQIFASLIGCERRMVQIILFIAEVFIATNFLKKIWFKLVIYEVNNSKYKIESNYNSEDFLNRIIYW